MQEQSPIGKLASLLPAFIVAAAWWLLTRPYHGLWHDGVFYAVQALKNLYPEQYAHDVFFMYGSQDDFTLYSKVQAWMTGTLGMERSLMLLALSGAALWIYALVRLMGRWLSGVCLVFALIVTLTLDGHYAGYSIFSFGEGFATPRIFSEALVLLSIFWWLDGRMRLAGGALLGAALLHPLMALAGIGVICWASLRKLARPVMLWWVLLALGLLGLEFLLWVGLSPKFDQIWKQLVIERIPYLFPHMWGLNDWLRIILDATLLWLVVRHVQGEAGKLASWVLPIFALGLLISTAAGLLDIQLAVAAQIHRVHWLAHLLALGLTVPLCTQLWQTSDIWKRFLAISAASSLLMPYNYGAFLLPSVYLFYSLAKIRMPDIKPSRPMVLLLLGGIPLILLFDVAANLSEIILYNQKPVWLNILIQTPVALWLLAFAYVLAKRFRAERFFLWICGAVVLSAGVLHWNSSYFWNGYDQPERVSVIAPVQDMIAKDDVVYWEDGIKGFEKTWFWLQRSNYVSFHQAVSGLFYRKAAIETARRIEHVHKWGFQDGNLHWVERSSVPKPIPLTLERIRGVCGDPILDYVITDTQLEAASLSLKDPLSGNEFSIYDCAVIRAG